MNNKNATLDYILEIRKKRLDNKIKSIEKKEENLKADFKKLDLNDKLVVIYELLWKLLTEK